MLKKFLILTVAAIIFSNSADAAKIDVYRNAILNKTFTIKYEISTPPVVESNGNGNLSDKGFSSAAAGFQFSLQNGISVANNEDRYIEIYFKNNFNFTNRDAEGKIQTSHSKENYMGSCQLTKGNEVFNFYYEVKNGVKKYYSYGNEGDYKTPYQILLDEYSLGYPALTNAFIPLLPPEKVIDTPQTPKYKFIGSGNLGNNLSFEDFASDRNDIFSAVRYYFEGDKLVKIAQASYLKNGNEISAYEKSVINITEFSTTADQSYLSLPAKLKDKIKRNKEKKK